VKAEKRNGKYFVSGQKVWISTAQVAEKVLLLARADAGLTLFYTDIDRKHVEIREIEKMGRHAVDSNQVFFDALPVPEADRIGEEGKGFEYILHGMNPERILIAAELVGLGRCAVMRAAKYAKERIVFDRPIGQNQAIQHPLAANWATLEAAGLMALKAATLYDAGKPCGAEANAAKYLAGEACFDACQQAVMTHGGYGYAKEYHVERYLRESLVGRIAPVTPHMILCFIAEKVLGLPKSY
jgi:acyl-CoA dehydrogenase